MNIFITILILSSFTYTLSVPLKNENKVRWYFLKNIFYAKVKKAMLQVKNLIKIKNRSKIK